MVAVVRDTTINGRTQTLPIQVTRRVYTMWIQLACINATTPARVTCNPIRPGRVGSTRYFPYQPGFTSALEFNRPLTQNSDILLTASPMQVAARTLTQRDLDAVRVVPNPFIVQSEYDRLQPNGSTTSRIYFFTRVPPEGMLRIYTVSGQLVLQLSWTPADLVTTGNGAPHGELPYNLRTREGLDLASGLYVYVLTARGPNANGRAGRGKFVVIR